MIPDKKMQAAAGQESTVFITPKSIARTDRVRDVQIYGMCEAEGGWQRAEGLMILFRVGGALDAIFEADGVIYGAKDGFLYDCARGDVLFSGEAVNDMLLYFPPSGGKTVYALTASDLYRLDGKEFVPLGIGGGSCLAFFGERLFRADGTVLSYTAPLEAENWDVEGLAGVIPLYPEGGNVLALLPFPDHLLVVREWELLRFEAEGSDLDFRFERIAFDGNIIEKTAQKCGTYAVFRTERGIFTVKGRACALALPAPADWEFGIGSAAYGGKYYAPVRRAGEQTIFVFDPESGEHYFLLEEMPRVFSGENCAYALSDGNLYRILGRGGECKSELSFSLAGISRNRPITGMRIEGDGAFTVEIAGEGGGTKFTLHGGVYHSLRHTIFGTQVHISVRSEGIFRLNCLQICLREELK